MNFVTGTKIGTRVNVMINGKLHSKDCMTEEAAIDFFNAVKEAKQNPTDEAIDSLKGFLNKNIRLSKVAGFEYDPQTGETYLKGFETPVPSLIMETIENYVENGFPVDSIVNFWKLLMLNPDKRVRESLFGFIQEHDFSLTDKGYMVVYKALDYLEKIPVDLRSFVSNSYITVRKWKKNPDKYVVYEQWNEVEETVWIDEYDEAEDHGMSEDEFIEEFGYEPEYSEGYEDVVTYRTMEYKITKVDTFETWDVDEKDVVLVGNLKELQEKIDKLNDVDTSIFTPIYTSGLSNDNPKKQKIKIGEPVKFERYECDSDPTNECSYGLHVGATKYVEKFGSKQCPVLLCLVNPMNVIAVPEYDNSKMRVCEYYPFGLATRNEDGQIDVIDQPYFESDYETLVNTDLESMLEKAMEGEEFRPAVDVIEAGDERTEEEYMKILESRVVELNNS